jgi:hypothetical protein
MEAYAEDVVFAAVGIGFARVIKYVASQRRRRNQSQVTPSSSYFAQPRETTEGLRGHHCGGLDTGNYVSAGFNTIHQCHGLLITECGHAGATVGIGGGSQAFVNSRSNPLFVSSAGPPAPPENRRSQFSC